MIFDNFKGTLSHHNYEIYFANFLHYAYMNRDFDLVDTILFKLDLSTEQRNRLVYEMNYISDNGESFILSVIGSGDITLIEKINEKYPIDISKIKIHNLFRKLFSNNHYPEIRKHTLDEKYKLIELFISLNIDSVLENIKSNGKSYNNPFSELTKTMKAMYFSERSDRKPGAMSTYNYINRYIVNSNTTIVNYFFWMNVFSNDLQFVQRNYSKLNKEEKEDLFILTGSEKEINYKILDLFLSDDSFELNKKVNEQIALVRFIKANSKFTVDDRIKISEKFLEAGSRINNINQAGWNLKKLIVIDPINYGKPLESNIEKAETLLEKYKNNIEETISFDLNGLNFERSASFEQVTIILSQLKDILVKKGFYKEIKDIMFIRKEDNEIYIFIDSETIILPIESISGNEFTQNSFRKA